MEIDRRYIDQNNENVEIADHDDENNEQEVDRRNLAKKYTLNQRSKGGCTPAISHISTGHPWLIIRKQCTQHKPGYYFHCNRFPHQENIWRVFFYVLLNVISVRTSVLPSFRIVI